MFKNLNESFRQKINRFLLVTLFVCYILIFVWAIFLKCNRKTTIDVLANRYLLYNLNERWMFQFSFHTFNDPQAIRQFLLNIPLFVPLTLFLPLLFNKDNIFRDLIITLLVTLLVETIQLFTSLGAFDYKDICTNFIGGLLGCIIYKLFRKHTKNIVINYILLVFTIIAVPFSIFCIVNTIIHFDYYLPFFAKEIFENLFNF